MAAYVAASEGGDGFGFLRFFSSLVFFQYLFSRGLNLGSLQFITILQVSTANDKYLKSSDVHQLQRRQRCSNCFNFQKKIVLSSKLYD
jgi:hypothetical protein